MNLIMSSEGNGMSVDMVAARTMHHGSNTSQAYGTSYVLFKPHLTCAARSCFWSKGLVPPNSAFSQHFGAQGTYYLLCNCTYQPVAIRIILLKVNIPGW